MSAKDDEEYQKARDYYGVFMDERRVLSDARQKHYRSFDKYLLSLSAGTFGLTVTFLHEVIPHVVETTKWMLLLSWGLLVGTILLVLVSFLTSIAAYSIQILINEKIFVTKPDKKNYDVNAWTIITNCVNIASIVAFVLGEVFLFIFVAQNY